MRMSIRSLRQSVSSKISNIFGNSANDNGEITIVDPKTANSSKRKSPVPPGYRSEGNTTHFGI